MARGIDASAHKGALAVRGRTIAVLGSGIDVVYPPENKELYAAIQEKGAVVSEFPFGTPPNAPNFPARNRIISGMSLGVVVVEASEKSGSLITARTALEQGREVFAIPGSIDSPGSRGTHKLIKEGATLVECIDDILTVISPQVKPTQGAASSMLPQKTEPDPGPVQNIGKDITKTRTLNVTEALILKLLCEKPVHVDAIIQTSRLKTADALNSLLTLELYGLIRQLPGKMYIRKEGT
jgi:DNA processing protein